MSYARLSKESEVYVYQSERAWNSPEWNCCWCRLSKSRRTATTSTPEEMADHLELHRKAGHLVPQQAIDDLRNDHPGVG